MINQKLSRLDKIQVPVTMTNKITVSDVPAEVLALLPSHPTFA